MLYKESLPITAVRTAILIHIRPEAMVTLTGQRQQCVLIDTDTLCDFDILNLRLKLVKCLRQWDFCISRPRLQRGRVTDD